MRVAEARRTLGLPSAALASSWEDVRAAFKRAVLQAHPDKGGEAKAFIRIMFAFRLLTGQRAAAAAVRARSAAAGCAEPGRGEHCASTPATSCEGMCARPQPGRKSSSEAHGSELVAASSQLRLGAEDEVSSQESEHEVFAGKGSGPRRIGTFLRRAQNSSGFRGISKQLGLYCAQIVVRGLHVKVLPQKSLEEAIQAYVVLVEIKEALMALPDVWSSEVSCASAMKTLLESALHEVCAAESKESSSPLEAHALRFRWCLSANKILGRQIFKRHIRVYTPFTPSLMQLVEDWQHLRGCAGEGSPDTLRTALHTVWSAQLSDRSAAVLRSLNARLATAAPASAEEYAWEKSFRQLRQWLQSRGGIYPKDVRRGERLEHKLARWLAKQRTRRRRGTFCGLRARLLEDLPAWKWGACEPKKRWKQRAWDVRLADLRSWLGAHGGQYPSRVSKSVEERSLAEWVKSQRRLLASGKSFILVSRQIDLLEALPGWGSSRRKEEKRGSIRQLSLEAQPAHGEQAQEHRKAGDESRSRKMLCTVAVSDCIVTGMSRRCGADTEVQAVCGADAGRGSCRWSRLRLLSALVAPTSTTISADHKTAPETGAAQMEHQGSHRKRKVDEFRLLWCHASSKGGRGIPVYRSLQRRYPRGVVLAPAPVSPAVVQSFIQVYSDSSKNSLCPVFHGTNAVNYESIFRHGLLIPGEFNGVRVAHGSAHGLGIYTAKLHALALATAFANTSSVLVCGVVDNAVPLACTHALGCRVVTAESTSVKHVGDAMVVFDQRCVLPLFVALAPGAQRAWQLACRFSLHDFRELQRWFEANRSSLSPRAARRLRRAWGSRFAPTLEHALLGRWRHAHGVEERADAMRLEMQMQDWGVLGEHVYSMPSNRE